MASKHFYLITVNVQLALSTPVVVLKRSKNFRPSDVHRSPSTLLMRSRSWSRSWSRSRSRPSDRPTDHKKLSLTLPLSDVRCPTWGQSYTDFYTLGQIYKHVYYQLIIPVIHNKVSRWHSGRLSAFYDAGQYG